MLTKSFAIAFALMLGFGIALSSVAVPTPAQAGMLNGSAGSSVAQSKHGTQPLTEVRYRYRYR